jgi:DNA-binding NtrC family response regulator
MTEWLKILLEHAGYEVRTALIGTRGEEFFKAWHPDAVVTDMMLPDIDGIDLVRKFKQIDPEAEVIVITGQGNIPRSVEAVKAGAFDFLEKPIDAERLLDKLEKALKQKSLIDENEQLEAKLQDRYGLSNVVGKSKKMQDLFELIESVGGERSEHPHPGRERHRQGTHRQRDPLQEQAVEGPFIKINCAGDSEGPDRVGAVRLQEGRVHRRDAGQGGPVRNGEGGSLLLTRSVRCRRICRPSCCACCRSASTGRLAASRIVHVDFRLSARPTSISTRRCATGKLREDLYFRINTITLRVPPLRERTEDIPLLCDYFLDKFRQRYQKNVETLAPSVYHLLIRNRWPGNVRELENAIERAVLVSKGTRIAVTDLPESIRGDPPAPPTS